MTQDLSGITVLDIGAWDGFFSFEAERRGAKRVLATDLPAWVVRPGWERGKDGFMARKALGSSDRLRLSGYLTPYSFLGCYAT